MTSQNGRGISGRDTKAAPSRRRGLRTTPVCEQVESRQLLATTPLTAPPTTPLDPPIIGTFKVINTKDSGAGSLRQAILDANANGTATTDTIIYNIPKSDPGFVNGVYTIKPLTELPSLSATVLDGVSQTTFTGDTNTLGPEIVINGSLQARGHGLRLNRNNTIANVVINGFNRDASGGYAILGNTDASGGNTVLNAYVGTDPTGAAAVPNLQGIGPGAGSTNNRVEGCLISGNAGAALLIGDSHDSLYLNNRIGTNRVGLGPIPNGAMGVWIGGSTAHNNRFEANHIAFNHGDGILDSVDYRFGNGGHYGNAFRRNGMHQNDGLGINIRMPPLNSNQGNEVNPNDPRDADTGGNGLQNYPVVAVASAIASTTTFSGTLNSRPNTRFEIEVFVASTLDATGYGEGESYLGMVAVTTDAGGNAGWSLTASGNYTGKFASTTATDPGNNTSEFSQARIVGSLVVTNTNDSGPGSLRAAIDYANSNGSSSTDAILFNIPKTDPGFANGVFTIRPLTTLPVLRATVLDGATQTTFSGDTNPLGPEVVINGSLQTAGHGLRVESGNTVANLVINGFNRDPGGGYGILGVADVAGANVIRNDYIGTDPTGTSAVPNIIGIGIGAGTFDNRVEGNLISGSVGYGIAMGDNHRGLFLNNRIGTNRVGLAPIPNGAAGIWIGGSTAHDNRFEGNHIAFNHGDGIFDAPDYRAGNGGHYNNTFRRNRMHQNDGLGINLRMPPLNSNQGNEVNPNDPRDADTGGNGLQNYPVVAVATSTFSTTTVSGTLNSRPNTAYEIEVFANTTLDATGYGEGESYLGLVKVTTNAQGDATWSLSVAGNYAGKFISTTATDPAGNTSEFSRSPVVLRTDLKMTSAVANGTDTLTVSYSIANVAATPFDIGFFTSVDASFGAGDGQIKTFTISNPSDLSLGTHTRVITIGAAGLPLPGYNTADPDSDYFLLAVLDPSNSVAEEDADPFAEDNTAVITGAYHPANGPLYIQSGEGSDSISLSTSGSNLVVAINGSERVYVGGATGEVDRIFLRSHGGNDSILATTVGRYVRLWAGGGNDLVRAGSARNDLFGGIGNDTLVGGNAHDAMDGGEGDDSLLGGGGDDFLLGDLGNDSIDGGPGNDALYGRFGDDSLIGGTGDDFLDDGIGTNRLDGSAGNDMLHPGSGGTDTVLGGSGNDTLVAPNLLNTWNLTGLNAGKYNGSAFSNVENLAGGDSTDTFTISSGGLLSGAMNGAAGADTITYAPYGAPVTVDLGSRTASGMRGFLNIESFSGGSASDSLFGPEAATTWQITAANAGSAGAVAFAGFENLIGGAANDTFQFGNGKTISGVVDGGAGVNQLDYSLYSADVILNLAAGTGTGVGGVTSIQNVTGGSGADRLVGDEDDNVLLGNAGNDTIDGGVGGDDLLAGGTGNDTIRGSRGGRNLIIGGLGADALFGGDDEDLILNGVTSFDSQVGSLQAILDEWKRTDLAYAQRVDHLLGVTAGGLNGSIRLTPVAVQDDPDTDSLNGGNGLDWFWAPLSELIDRVAQERVK